MAILPSLAPNGKATPSREITSPSYREILMVPIDSAFDPNASGNVYAMAYEPDGRRSWSAGLLPPSVDEAQNIARLEAISGAADGWNPDASGDVYAIALQPDGKIIVGGGFTNIGGQPRNRIARLDTKLERPIPSIRMRISMFFQSWRCQTAGYCRLRIQ